MEKTKEKEEKQSLFEDIPIWNNTFKNMERQIRLFDAYRWNACTTKENLTKKYEDMLQMAKDLTNIDLHILYYIRLLRGIDKYSLFHMLQKLYLAECEFLNELLHTDEYVDIFDIGQVENNDWRFLPKKERKNYKKPEKTP